MTREEAINEIKSWAIPSEKGREVLEILIPELRESEDERIRKAIVGLIEELQRSDKYFAGVELTDMLAYLEKQKEPHYTKRNALFDKCVENCDPNVMREVSDKIDEMLEKEQKPIISAEESLGISQEEYNKIVDECIYGEQKEQKPTEWSEEDEKMLRTIISDGSRGVELDSKQISWLKSLRPSWKPSEKQMKALEDAFRKDGSDEYRKIINSLYQDLKKL